MSDAFDYVDIDSDAITSFDTNALAGMSLSSTDIDQAIASDRERCDLPETSWSDKSALEDALAFEALSFAIDNHKEASAEKEETNSHNDTWVLLRPEGLVRSLTKMKQSEPDDRTIRTRFQSEVKVQIYSKYSAPSLQRESSTNWSLSIKTSVPAVHPQSVSLASYLQDKSPPSFKVQDQFNEYEEVLDLLGRSLSTDTNDPKSVAFAELAIQAAREAIQHARLDQFEDQEKVQYAVDSVEHAHCFHEETMRRVNRAKGPCDFESFERDAVGTEEAIHKRRLGDGSW